MVEVFQVFTIFSLPPVRGPCEALQYEDTGELGRASGIRESVILMPCMIREVVSFPFHKDKARRQKLRFGGSEKSNTCLCP